MCVQGSWKERSWTCSEPLVLNRKDHHRSLSQGITGWTVTANWQLDQMPCSLLALKLCDMKSPGDYLGVACLLSHLQNSFFLLPPLGIHPSKTLTRLQFSQNCFVLALESASLP